MKNKWLHVEWKANYTNMPGLVLVGTRYGIEYHREVSEGDNSGSRERSNQRQAISAMEAWATANGYAGLVWDNYRLPF
jgi:hypothetical protein